MPKIQSGAGSGPAAAINVTPLIDVLLVLLIIFMVIQPHREAKLPVRAPAQSEQPGPAPPETLMLTVTRDFELALNSKSLSLEDLIPTLGMLMSERLESSRTLFIKAPAGLSYASIVSLIDLAKGAGVITIGLVKSSEFGVPSSE